MRQIYVDEAGTSGNKDEPVAVCVGIIVNPDKQWRILEAHLKSIEREYFGSNSGKIIFHAKDIWHGSGHFPRAQFSRQDRLKILTDIVSAYQLYEMSFCVGLYYRDNLPKDGKINLMHLMAYLFFMSGVDEFLKDKNEIGTIVSEDEPSKRSELKLIHEFAKGNVPEGVISPELKKFVVKNIVDTVHFAQKSENALLQYADIFAFIFRRLFSGKGDVDEIVNLVTNAKLIRDVEIAERGAFHVFSQEAPDQDSKSDWNVTYARRL